MALNRIRFSHDHVHFPKFQDCVKLQHILLSKSRLDQLKQVIMPELRFCRCLISYFSKKVLVPIPTFYKVVAHSNFPKQNWFFQGMLSYHANKMWFWIFFTYFLQITDAISHIFQSDNLFEWILQKCLLHYHVAVSILLGW